MFFVFPRNPPAAMGAKNPYIPAFPGFDGQKATCMGREKGMLLVLHIPARHDKVLSEETSEEGERP